jgi:hypothetical protein
MMKLEIVLGVVMTLIGITALGYVIYAKKKFPEGSELKTIAGSIVKVIFFLTCYSIWHVVREAFYWKERFGNIAEYPEYLFISVAFLMLLICAKHIYCTAKKLGITE